MTIEAAKICDIIQQILPDRKSIPLHEPFFDGNEASYLSDCIKTRFVSSVGAYVDQFEQQIARFTGAKFAVATVNGTSALHISLLLAGVAPGHEVLVPSLTFAATANAVTYCGATPHFVDADPETLGLNTDKLGSYLSESTTCENGQCVNKKTGKLIKAVVPVHVFGHPVDMDPLIDLCQKYHIVIVEDAAESLGSFYKGRHTGNFGLAAALSFNGNKIITTGGGGAIVSNDKNFAQKAKHLTTTAKKEHGIHHYHDQVGYNYRMPNINAALGVAQLEQLPQYLKQKRDLAKRYKSGFNAAQGTRILWEPDSAKSNFWLNTLILDKPDPEKLEQIIQTLLQKGIGARPLWMPLHELPMYHSCPKMDLTNTQRLKHQIINLPSSIHL